MRFLWQLPQVAVPCGNWQLLGDQLHTSATAGAPCQRGSVCDPRLQRLCRVAGEPAGGSSNAYPALCRYTNGSVEVH
jgi:hypothetical protein